MNTELMIFVTIAVILELLIPYYKIKTETIPIFVSFLTTYIFLTKIQDIFILGIVLLIGLLIYILKEFSINWESDEKTKTYNILLKLLFSFFSLSFCYIFVFTNNSLLFYLVSFMIFGYIYQVFFVSFFVVKSLEFIKDKFIMSIKKFLESKEEFIKDKFEDLRGLFSAFFDNQKVFSPIRFLFIEYFVLISLLSMFYVYYLVKAGDIDVFSVLIFLQLVYFSIIFILRTVWNSNIYPVSFKVYEEFILGTINKYEKDWFEKQLKELIQENQKLKKWIDNIGRFYSKLDDNPDFEDLYTSIYSVLSKSLNFSRFVILMVEKEDKLSLKPVFYRGVGREEFFIKETAIELVNNSLKSVYYFGGTVFSALALFKDDRSFICSPVKVSNKLIGIVYLSSLNTRSFNEEDVKLVEIMCDRFAIMYILYQEYSKSRDMAIKDGLTGLYTHRYFQEILSKEIENAKMYGYPVCLLMIDTDKFKQYNDTFGHPMGDELLKSIAKIITSHVKDKGYVCRYGGDEFAVILPNFYKENAKSLAEEIRNSYKPLKKGDIQVSASIGVACFPLDASSKDELIKKADELLYIAKREGRNRVIVA